MTNTIHFNSLLPTVKKNKKTQKNKDNGKVKIKEQEIQQFLENKVNDGDNN